MMDKVFVHDILKRRLSPTKYMQDVFKIYVEQSVKGYMVVIVLRHNVEKVSSIEMALNRMFNDIDGVRILVRAKGKLHTYGVSRDADVFYECGSWLDVQ